MTDTQQIGIGVAAGVGALGAVVFLFAFPVEPARALFTLLLAGAALWITLRLVRGANAYFRAHDLFAPLVAFPLLYVVWFAIGSLDLFRMLARQPVLPLAEQPWAYYAAGLAAYVLGVLTVKSQKKPLPLAVPQQLKSVWPAARFREITTGLFVLLLLAFLYLTWRVGIPLLDPDFGESRLQISQHGIANAVFLSSAWTVAPFLLARVWVKRVAAARARWYYLGAAAVFGLLLSQGGRASAFQLLLVLVIAANYLRGRVRVTKLAAVMLVIFIALGLFGYVRDLTLRGRDPLAAFREPDMTAALVPVFYAYRYIHSTVSTFQDVAAIIPRELDYQWGRLTLAPLATPLPGTQETADIFFKRILGLDFVGLGTPAGILGTFYGDFGLVGILAGMFALGYLMQRFYTKLKRERTVYAVLLYAWMAHVALYGLFAGPFPYITHLWIPVQLWILDGWMRRRAVFSHPVAGAGDGFGGRLELRPGPRGAMPH